MGRFVYVNQKQIVQGAQSDREKMMIAWMMSIQNEHCNAVSGLYYLYCWMGV